jgi:hypothetical protein
MVHEVSRRKAWKIDGPRARSVNLQFLPSFNTAIETRCGKTKASRRISSQPVISASKRIQEISPIPNRKLALYTILLALGQIMGANYYQITLLSGPQGRDEEKFYMVSGIYLAASIFWWLCYSSFQSLHLLSVPFLRYGLSLLLLENSPYFLTAGLTLPRLQNTATALYTIASAPDHYTSPTISATKAAPQLNPGSSVPAPSKARNRSTSALSGLGVRTFIPQISSPQSRLPPLPSYSPPRSSSYSLASSSTSAYRIITTNPRPRP